MRPAVVLAFGCVVVATRPAAAEYSPPSFSECVFGADVIVVGRIESLRETDYDLRVEDWIHGAKPAESLRVYRFKDWTCGHREPPYAAGQRLVAFLHADDDGFASMGGGCEGDVVLEDGAARMTMLPGGFGGWASPVPEGRFIGGVRVLRAGTRDPGDLDYQQAWRALLAHTEPLVVATAIERLDARGFRRSSQFSDLIVDAIGNPDIRVALYAAGRIGDWIGKADRGAVEARLTATARTGSPELRPAAALGRLCLNPADPDRYAEIVTLLADPSIPVGDRDALAIALYRWPDIPRKLDLGNVDAAARDALPRIDDPSLLLHLCRYLDRVHQRDWQFPRPDDAEAERAKWMRRLDPGANDPDSTRSIAAIALVVVAGFLVVAFVLLSRRRPRP